MFEGHDWELIYGYARALADLWGIEEPLIADIGFHIGHAQRQGEFDDFPPEHKVLAAYLYVQGWLTRSQIYQEMAQLALEEEGH